MINQQTELDHLFKELPFEEAICFVLNLLGSSVVITTSIIQSVRKTYPQFTSFQQLTILEVALGTNRGQRLGKFLPNWFVTPILAEQATHFKIAEYHSSNFYGLDTVLEVCTGSGNDTAALSQNVATVHTFENNFLHFLLAQRNCNKIGIKNIQFHFGTIEEASFSTIKFQGIWADPSRRDTKGKRSFSIDGYSPSLDFLFSISKECSIAGIKVSPSIHHTVEIGWSREFIGFEKECKEEILWKKSDNTYNSLTLIDRLSQWKYNSDKVDALTIQESLNEGMYLYEPHSVLIRSKMVQKYFSEKNISLLDKESVFGISNELKLSEFFVGFKIISVVKFKTRELQAQIDKLGWNERTEIKKRNFHLLPEEIQKNLSFRVTSKSFGVIICTRHNGKATAIFAERVR